MMKNIKKLKKLKKLQYRYQFLNESSLHTQGFSKETLANEINHYKQKVLNDINAVGWLLMVLIFIPLALMQLFDIPMEEAAFLAYTGAGIIMMIIVKIT